MVESSHPSHQLCALVSGASSLIQAPIPSISPSTRHSSTARVVVRPALGEHSAAVVLPVAGLVETLVMVLQVFLWPLCAKLLRNSHISKASLDSSLNQVAFRAGEVGIHQEIPSLEETWQELWCLMGPVLIFVTRPSVGLSRGAVAISLPFLSCVLEIFRLMLRRWWGKTLAKACFALWYTLVFLTMYWFIVSNFRRRLCLKCLFKYSDSSGICGPPKLRLRCFMRWATPPLKLSQSGRLPVTSFLAVPLISCISLGPHRYLFPYAIDCSHCSACSSYSWYEAASPDHCGTPSLLVLISTILISFPFTPQVPLYFSQAFPRLRLPSKCSDGGVAVAGFTQRNSSQNPTALNPTDMAMRYLTLAGTAEKDLFESQTRSMRTWCVNIRLKCWNTFSIYIYTYIYIKIYYICDIW